MTPNAFLHLEHSKYSVNDHVEIYINNEPKRMIITQRERNILILSAVNDDSLCLSHNQRISVRIDLINQLNGVRLNKIV